MKQGKKALSLLAVVAFLVMALVPMTALAAELENVTVTLSAKSGEPLATVTEVDKGATITLEAAITGSAANSVTGVTVAATVTASGGSAGAPSSITLMDDDSDGTYTGTYTANTAGSVQFVATATDGNDTTVSTAVTVTVNEASSGLDVTVALSAKTGEPLADVTEVDEGATITLEAAISGTAAASVTGVTVAATVTPSGGSAGAPSSIDLTDDDSDGTYTGTYTANTAGSVQFVATATDGDATKASDPVTVTIRAAQTQPTPAVYTVSAAQGLTGGTVSVSPQSAAEGTAITVTPTANTGYRVTSVAYTRADNGAVTQISPQNGVYSFVMPAADVTVSANFQQDAAPAVSGPTISGPVSVTAGQTIQLTVMNNALGTSGSIATSGLEFVSCTSTPASGTEEPCSATDVVLLNRANATYTYTVTGTPGSTASFALSNVVITDGTSDMPSNNAVWEAVISTGASSVQPGTSTPSTMPVPPSPSTAPSAAPSSAPGASSSPDASASAGTSSGPSASASAEPSGTASPAPSGSTSTEPSEEPAQPVEVNPEATDVPETVEVTENPSGSGSVMTGIEVGTPNAVTNVENVTSWVAVPEGATVEVVDSAGEPVPPTQPIGTGMVIEVRSEDGRILQSTTVVVRGDVTGSGEMNLTQLVRMAQGYTGANPLEGVYQEAADLNGDGNVTLTDLVMEAQMFRAAGLTMEA